ncbi:MAG TPA: hypothetical protein DCM27_02965 [Rhodospirillaceae bacterium]|nr:hypothetical protein [Rhodospirillaceae bacterium]
MKFISKTKASFMKAAGHPIMQTINENAAKITSASFLLADGILASYNYLKNKRFDLDLPPTTPDQWMSVSGLSYLASSLVFAAGDKYNWIKKPVGLLGCAGATAMRIAAKETGWELYMVAAAPLIGSLSLIFEDTANKAAKHLTEYQNIFAKAANAYLTYPLVSIAALQTGSALSAIYTGLTMPDQGFLVPHGMAWFVGNFTLALTDNNVRTAIRAAAPQQSANMEQRAP